jgi:hypothetical protein
MRFFAFSALTLAFIGTVSSKLEFGPCRTDAPRLAYDDFASAVNALDPAKHRIVAADGQLLDMIAFIE